MSYLIITKTKRICLNFYFICLQRSRSNFKRRSVSYLG